MIPYQANKWNWVVGGDAGRHWSAESGGWVNGAAPAGRVTRIASVEDLAAVLKSHGLPHPPLSVDDYSSAIQDHLDAKARERRYDGILSAITYRDDPNQQFAAEAAALFAWRSAVWTAAQVMLDGLGGGEPPPIESVIAALPDFVWPE